MHGAKIRFGRRLIHTSLFQTTPGRAMTMNLRISRVSFVVFCGLTAGLLAEPPAARAGCNSGNVANTDLLSSANCQANASGSATAVGLGATATGTNSAAFGNGAFGQGVSSTAIGVNSGPTGAVNGSTAVGAFAGSLSSGTYSTAIGAGQGVGSAPSATGNFSVAVGGGDGTTINGARANGNFAAAVGSGSQLAATSHRRLVSIQMLLRVQRLWVTTPERPEALEESPMTLR